MEALRKTSQMGDAIERRMHTQSLMRHREELAAMEEVLEGFIEIQREQHTAGERSAVANKKTVTGMLGVLNSYGKAKETVQGLNEETGKTEVTTRKLENTLGFLINTLEEVPNEKIWQPIDEGAKATTQTLGELMTMLEETPVTTFGEEINTANTFLQAMTDTAATFGNIIGSAFASMISGAKSGKEAMKEMAKGIISAALAASQASIIEAMINSGKFTGPAAPIVIPILVASGVALVSGLFSSLPAFADGGIVSGPTMGLVGEYPGAKTNPEVIAPLDKLRSMMGGQNVVVTGRLSGRDILLTSERNAIDRNRVRGF